MVVVVEGQNEVKVELRLDLGVGSCRWRDASPRHCRSGQYCNNRHLANEQAGGTEVLCTRGTVLKCPRNCQKSKDNLGQPYEMHTVLYLVTSS